LVAVLQVFCLRLHFAILPSPRLWQNRMKESAKARTFSRHQEDDAGAPDAHPSRKKQRRG
jgi:hypothetical protein